MGVSPVGVCSKRKGSEAASIGDQLFRRVCPVFRRVLNMADDPMWLIRKGNCSPCGDVFRCQGEFGGMKQKYISRCETTVQESA